MSNAHDSLARSLALAAQSSLLPACLPVSEQLTGENVAGVGRFVTITEGRKITILRNRGREEEEDGMANFPSRPKMRRYGA